VLAVACAVNDPKVIDEIEKTRTRLRKREIEFEPLFAGELTEKLRTQATIIDDFFGRAWVEKICAPEDVIALPTACRASETQKNSSRIIF
jgi:hypothetical protein